MESILTDIIKESKIITGLKSVFMDFLDFLIVIFIFLWVISYLHKNFDIKNKLLDRYVSKFYFRRNYIYLVMFSITTLLIISDKSGVRNYIITYGESAYMLFIIIVGFLLGQIFKKLFEPKEIKPNVD